jgi:hypothetical protein
MTMIEKLKRGEGVIVNHVVDRYDGGSPLSLKR